MYRLFLCSLLSVLFLLAPMSSAVAQTSRSFTGKTISVSGEGSVSLTPDIARISIGVTSENESASLALTSNNAATQAVMQSLKSFPPHSPNITTVIL